ncbi:unnamed protein product [Effrenium voratum]|nr:unnamed protein product [Effrenium voratum]
MEVPQVLVAEQVRQVPYAEVQTVEREVPNVTYQPVEQTIVEVPQVLREERLVEVPQLQVAEFIKQVPKQQVQEVPKRIPKVEMRCVERVQNVPVQLIQEVAVEVPQVLRHEVITQVSQAAEQRIVQEAQEYSRTVRREEVVVGEGEGGYAGAYEARVVRAGPVSPSRMSMEMFERGEVSHTRSDEVRHGQTVTYGASQPAVASARGGAAYAGAQYAGGQYTAQYAGEARASPSTPRRPIPLGEAICSPSWTPTTMACSAEKSWRPWAEVARESQWPQESGASQSPACRPTLQPRRPMLPLRRPTLPLRRPTPPLRRPTLRLHREAISSPSWTPTKMACSVEKRWPWAEAAFGRPVRQES